MADETQKIDLSNCLPVVQHPSTGSGDCTTPTTKAGQTSDWNLPLEAFKADNPPQDYWQDEVTEVFVTTEDGETIELA